MPEGGPEFPTEALPGWLREWCEATTEALQVPSCLPSLLGLSAVAACVQGSYVVSPYAGWIEPLSLYTLTLLDPGERKSAVFRAATEPLVGHELALLERDREDVQQLGVEREIAERRLKQRMHEAVNDPSAVPAAVTARAALTKCEPRPSRRLLADNATPEALSGLLAQNDGRLAVMSPEGADLLSIITGTRYSKGGPALQALLNGHAGDRLRVDRVGADPICVDNPALTLGLAGQRELLRGLRGDPSLLERGLVARFVVALPVPRAGARVVRPPPVTPAIRDRYAARLHELAERCHPVARRARPPEPTVLCLDEKADTTFERFQEQIERRIGPSGDLRATSGWGAKLAGLTLRIGGLLALVADDEPSADRLSEDTIIAAFQIACWAAEHAKLVFGVVSRSDARQLAERVLDRCRRRGDAEVGLAQLKSAHRVDPNRLLGAMRLLEGHGYARSIDIEHRGAGRPRSPTWALNPAVFG